VIFHRHSFWSARTTFHFFLRLAEGEADSSSASSMLRGRARPRVSGSSRVPSPLQEGGGGGGQTKIMLNLFKSINSQTYRIFVRDPGGHQGMASMLGEH
jgi:hypothetical protein